jgi:hypothetical protein
MRQALGKLCAELEAGERNGCRESRVLALIDKL